MVVHCGVSQGYAGLITFDDYSSNPTIDSIANGYKGFNWNNVWVANKNYAGFAGTGFANGAVSGNYTGFNGFGSPAEITSSTLFDFKDVYLTGGFNPGTVTFQGFQGSTLLYTQSFNVNISTPQLVAFNFTSINRLRFGSTGGHFAMDNLTLNPVVAAVPEPTSFALLGIAATFTLGAVRRQRSRAESKSLSSSAT